MAVLRWDSLPAVHIGTHSLVQRTRSQISISRGESDRAIREPNIELSKLKALANSGCSGASHRVWLLCQFYRIVVEENIRRSEAPQMKRVAERSALIFVWAIVWVLPLRAQTYESSA